MENLIMEQEAAQLAARFRGVNRAAFARDHALKGGQSIIYQHINGLRPISLDAALVYAKAFGCGLEEISPRLAAEAAGAMAQTSPAAKMLAAGNIEAQPQLKPLPPYRMQWITDDEAELLSLYRATKADSRKTLLVVAAGLPKSAIKARNKA
jgi:hypothetical protein